MKKITIIIEEEENYSMAPMFPEPFTLPDYRPDPCRNCSNNRLNGGSGICF